MSNKTVYLSVDFEEWFHIPFMKPYINEETKSISFCDKLKPFFNKINSEGIYTTIFVVGDIAEKYKNELIDFKAAGNAIALHSLNHASYKKMSLEEFNNDVKQAKQLVESSIGEQVYGFRAPMFSANKEQLNSLKGFGFKFDSSAINSSTNPFYSRIKENDWNGDDQLNEYRIPTRRGVSLGGGGYFRAMPLWLYKIKVKNYMKKHDSFVFFLHPYEIVPEKFPGFKKGFMSYGYYRYNKGLKGVMKKFWKLLEWFKNNNYNFDVMK